MASKNLVGDTYTDEGIQQLQEQVNKVSEQLKNFNTTSATDDELRSRAESEYTPIYNAQVAEQEAAKQSAQSVLDTNLSALERQYGRDSESLNRSYDTQAVNANNSMIARGFNNSSLAAAMANYVNTQRNRALDNLSAERTAAENSARSTYNNAISAANANIGRLGSDLATNIDARYQALREAEQNRLYQQIQAQNALELEKLNLQMQIEELRRAAQNTYYSVKGSGSSSSSSSSGGSKTGTTGTTGTAAQTGVTSSLADKFNSSNEGSSAQGSVLSSVVSGIKNLVNTAATAAKKASGTSGTATGNTSNASNKKQTSKVI